MSRSTVKVSDLVDKANRYVAHIGLSQAEKRAINSFISGVLHDTGNYRGFSYNFSWTGSAEDYARQEDRSYYYSPRIREKKGG